ncbi:MAG: helix-turn-helix domain-containing protein [Acidimicrobiales bacterium]
MAHRYRLYPTAGQEALLEQHCGDARYVWNLALEQFNCWRPGRRSSPGSAERYRQLAEARQGTFLAEGSSSLQQQALRDFDQAVCNFFAGNAPPSSVAETGPRRGVLCPRCHCAEVEPPLG